MGIRARSEFCGGALATLKFRKSGVSTHTLRGRAPSGDVSNTRLIHVTTVGAARAILAAGQIETRFCKVFKKNLLYTFAFRPAYKVSESREKRSILDYFPFVFVIDGNSLPAPYHVYPFDTGGAFQGAFDEAASEWVYIDDYELTPDLSGVGSHIDWAFGSRRAYFEGEVRDTLIESVPNWDTGPITFAQIARLAQEGSNKPDKRASAIEVAFNHHVSLKAHVMFAVIPRQFLEDERGDNTTVIAALKANGIQWQTFEWQPNSAPEEFHREIEMLVRERFEAEGVLK